PIEQHFTCSKCSEVITLESEKKFHSLLEIRSSQQNMDFVKLLNQNLKWSENPSKQLQKLHKCDGKITKNTKILSNTIDIRIKGTCAIEVPLELKVDEKLFFLGKLLLKKDEKLWTFLF